MYNLFELVDYKEIAPQLVCKDTQLWGDCTYYRQNVI